MSGQGPSRMPPGRAGSLGACIALVALFALLSYSAALTKCATYDEPFHALAGWLKLHRSDFRMDYESLPLGTGWSALANPADAIDFDESDPNWLQLADDPYRGFELASDILYRTPDNDGAAFINRSRFMMLLIGMALDALVIAWAWKLGGPVAGLLAAVLFSLDPNLLGHAPLVKTDIAVSLAMAGTIMALWLAGRRLTIRNMLIFAIALAAAMNTKFSAILLWPMIFLLLGVRVMHPKPWLVGNRLLARKRERLWAAAVVILFAATVTWLGTWTAHGYRFAPARDSSVRLSSESYQYELVLKRYSQEHPQPSVLVEPVQPMEQLLAKMDQSLEMTQRALDDSSIGFQTKAHLQRSIDWARDLRNTVAMQAPPADAKLKHQQLMFQDAEYQLAFVGYFLTQPREASDLVVTIGSFMLEHHIMPAAWTNGLMVQYARSRVLHSYLLGEVRDKGSWYFFPLAFLVKTPVATLVALIAAMAFAGSSLRTRIPSNLQAISLPAQQSPSSKDRERVSDWSIACLVIPPLLFLAVAMTSDLNIGLRHIFPIYPFIYIAAATVMADALPKWGRPARFAAAGLAIMLLTETLLVWPNYISHFNFAAREWRDPLDLFGDSNLDWGQDLPALAHWQRLHPGKPLALAYFGTADPAFYGIAYDPLPAWPPPLDFADSHVMAVSATHLQGIFDLRYSGYRQLRPTEMLGGTIYLYYDLPDGRARARGTRAE